MKTFPIFNDVSPVVPVLTTSFFTYIRVADPHLFHQHFRLNTDTDPDLIRIQGFNDQKFEKNYSWKKKFGDQKLQFTYP
jgi:hypothetical protein